MIAPRSLVTAGGSSVEEMSPDELRAAELGKIPSAGSATKHSGLRSKI